MKHWTDSATAFPIFSTVIPGTGSDANVNLILYRAMQLLTEIGIPQDRIDALKGAVLAAPNYEAALSLIERWFRVEREPEEPCEEL